MRLLPLGRRRPPISSTIGRSKNRPDGRQRPARLCSGAVAARAGRSTPGSSWNRQLWSGVECGDPAGAAPVVDRDERAVAPPSDPRILQTRWQPLKTRRVFCSRTRRITPDPSGFYGSARQDFRAYKLMSECRQPRASKHIFCLARYCTQNGPLIKSGGSDPGKRSGHR